MSRHRWARRDRRTWAGGIMALALVLAAGTGAWAQFAQAAKQVGEAAVTVVRDDHNGAGFVVSPQGHVLTNKHVVGEATEVTVKLSNGDSLPAKVVKTAEKRDLCVLQVDKPGLPTVQFGSSAKVKQGDEVAALGAPLGLENSLTKGVVSNAQREIEGQQYLQIDAALNQGNSGGPIINEDGHVVGIATQAAKEAQNLGFAIPSDDVMRFLREADIPFSAALGHLPEGLDAAPAAGAAPAGDTPEAPGSMPPVTPPEPVSPLAQISWLTIAISAVVALLVALITTLVLAGQSKRQVPGLPPTPVAAPYPVSPAVSQPTPVRPAAPPPQEDLSDIDIELK